MPRRRTRNAGDSVGPLTTNEHGAVEPFVDESGAVRVDRRFTPAEAQELEEKRRREYEEAQLRKFQRALPETLQDDGETTPS